MDDLLAYISQESVSWAYFIKIDWPSGVLRLHSRLGDISLEGEVYKGIGSLGRIETLTSDAKLGPNNTAVTLSGIPSDLLAEATKVYSRGRPAVIYFGVIDENEQVVAYRKLFDGRIDRPSISRGSDNSVRLELASRLNDWNNTDSGRFTQESQHQRDPNDQAFRYMNQLPGRGIAWGDRYNPPALTR